MFARRWGAIVVTNVYASGGCPDELFIMAVRGEKTHWVLSALPNATMNINGSFIVEDNEELLIGARTASPALKDDHKCALVWSGFRPLGDSAPSSSPSSNQ